MLVSKNSITGKCKLLISAILSLATLLAATSGHSQEAVPVRTISSEEVPAQVDPPAISRPIIRALPVAPEPGEALPPPVTPGEEMEDSAVEIPQTTPGATAVAVQTEEPIEIKADIDETRSVEQQEDSILRFAPNTVTTNQALTEIPKKTVDYLKKSEPIRPDQLGSAVMTRTGARTFTFSVPAPRGQILDRHGYPLAQSTVSSYAAISFPTFESDVTDPQIITYAAERLKYANDLLEDDWVLTTQTVLEHYKNRRWLPLVFSSALSEEQVDLLKRQSMDGLRIHPIYERIYPNGETLSHVIGYVGERPPLNTGPILENEPMWRVPKGTEGLERSFDEHLRGVPGRINVIYEENGSKIKEEVLARPVPGYNVVTTIDLEMQQIAERVLANNVKRGAMVVTECDTGDIVAVASYPQFNPNDFIPFITQDNLDVLLNDPAKPLFPRAFRAAYPPASTFKVPVALAFMESGNITPNETRDCPAKWSVGNLVMRNHTSKGEGPMNVVDALTRSCNTWFYEIATYAGADAMSSMALRMGMGQKSGIPLNDVAGFVPTNRVWWDRYGHGLSDGDEAVMSIGQGQVLATPLQVASMMGSVGNGIRVLKPRLVSQIQDLNHEIIHTFPSETANILNVDTHNLSAVRRGMYNVVNAGNGTGKSAYHKITVSGKTGTGQWIPAKDQYVAWFAGYFPSNYPVYSFAVLYEGDPGEKVSGGKKAAPLVKEFLTAYLNDDNFAKVKEASNELKNVLGDELQAMPVVQQNSSIFRSVPTNNNQPTRPAQGSQARPGQGNAPAQPQGNPGKPRRGFFDRLFRKK